MDNYKIAFLIGKLSNGGAERVIANLANQFYKKGHSSTVITFFDAEDEYELLDGVKRITIGDRNNGMSGLKATFFHHKKIRRLLLNEKYDILVSFMSGENFHSIWSAIGLKTKIIISVRNDPKREYDSLLRKILAKVVFPLANGCVFQTEEAKIWFPKRLQQKSVVIFNPVEEKFYNTERDENNGLVVAFGRLDYQKNYPMLIKAFMKVVEKNKEIAPKLKIFGKGKLEAELIDIINANNMQDSILLCGHSNDVPDELSRASILALSSDFEGMPNAVMEAMAMGVPVVSTNCPCGGPKALIQDGKNGFLVPVGDDDALANKIELLLSDAELRNSFSLNEKCAAKEFTQSAIYAKWDNYIRTILRDGKE